MWLDLFSTLFQTKLDTSWGFTQRKAHSQKMPQKKPRKVFEK